jgi:hypothetical protein
MIAQFRGDRPSLWWSRQITIVTIATQSSTVTHFTIGPSVFSPGRGGSLLATGANRWSSGPNRFEKPRQGRHSSLASVAPLRGLPTRGENRIPPVYTQTGSDIAFVRSSKCTIFGSVPVLCWSDQPVSHSGRLSRLLSVTASGADRNV